MRIGWDNKDLLDLLSHGWEPFAVDTDAAGRVWYHLKRTEPGAPRK